MYLLHLKNKFNIWSAWHFMETILSVKIPAILDSLLLRNSINRRYCTWRSEEKEEDGKQHQAFPVLYWSWQLPSALRFSSSFQTATFRSHQSGFKDVFWDGNVIRWCTIEKENKNKTSRTARKFIFKTAVNTKWFHKIDLNHLTSNEK